MDNTLRKYSLQECWDIPLIKIKQKKILFALQKLYFTHILLWYFL